MITLGELIDEVITTLHGQIVDLPAVGTLVGSIDALSSELALDFGDAPGASRPNGVLEIGSELFSVSRYDNTNGVASIPPWGRGYLGTTAATHAAGSKVIVRPRFPRKRVAQTINQVISASCPPLYNAKNLDPFDTNGIVVNGFPLPDDFLRILRVEAIDDFMDPTIAPRRTLRHWEVRSVAGAQMLILPQYEAFETVQVTIAANPGTLVNETDDFATVTGLPESAADMVVFGAIARLVLAGDIGRLQVTTIEAANRGDKVSGGSGTAVSRYYQAMYQQRLQTEQARLQSHYPLNLTRRG